MRNLPPTPNPPAPSSPTHCQLPSSGTARLSPARSRPPSLSPPVIDDVIPKAGSPETVGTGSPPGRQMTRNPCSTPVHVLQAHGVSRRCSVSPGMDEHVRSSLKDHLHVRQLIQAKMGMDEGAALRVVQHQHLEMQQQQQQQHPALMGAAAAEAGYVSKMDCDCQEEPEDLSLKPPPPRRSEEVGFSPNATRAGNPPLLSPTRGYSASSVYSPGRYTSMPSTGLSHPGLYHSGFHPPRPFTPPASKAYSPPPPILNGAADDNSSDDPSRLEDKKAMSCLVVPSAPQGSVGQEECGLPAVSDSPAGRTGGLTVVKTEPLHASAS